MPIPQDADPGLTPSDVCGAPASAQLRFEDVAVGDRLASLHKGPLTLVHLVRWAAAIENWHRIHYDRAFAIEHDGLPDALVHGTLKQQFLMQLLKDWAGREGWAWKVRFQFRAMDPVGSELEIWARVSGALRCVRYGLVELDLGITGDGVRASARGSALVALPFRDGAAVPYPFVPPLVDPWAPGQGAGRTQA